MASMTILKNSWDVGKAKIILLITYKVAVWLRLKSDGTYNIDDSFIFGYVCDEL